MMKKLLSLVLAALLLFPAALSLAKTVEPETEIDRFAGKTVHATVGAYSEETGTFTVTVYDCDRYDRGDAAKLEAGDTLLAGGYLYKITGQNDIDDTAIFLCEDGEEIYFGDAYDGGDDLIARSTMDDRIFMKAVAVLHLPAAEGIVYEDDSDPDLDAQMTVTKGLENILKVQAEKEEFSNGFNYYATSVTLNENLEIVKIHQDYDVAQ